MQPARSTR